MIQQMKVHANNPDSLSSTDCPQCTPCTYAMSPTVNQPLRCCLHSHSLPCDDSTYSLGHFLRATYKTNFLLVFFETGPVYSPTVLELNM